MKALQMVGCFALASAFSFALIVLAAVVSHSRKRSYSGKKALDAIDVSG